LDNGDLFRAAKEGDVARVREVIRAGVDVNYRDPDNTFGWASYDAVDVAAERGHVQVLQELIRAGARNLRFGEAGIMYKHTGVVAEWLRLNSDVNYRDESGFTPLMLAARSTAEITKMILAAGADPNELDEDGYTALALAMQAGNTAVVELLRAVTESDLREAAEAGRPVTGRRRRIDL
jgi:ankyrin repeat protein